MILQKIKFFWRLIKFHLYYKRKFSSSPGIPLLCSNIRHPYHESKFEQATCEILCDFFGERVDVPANHKYDIKFDFIIKNIAIVEPHGIWSSQPGENSYFEYYKKRRSFADQYSELKALPLLVLSNMSDLYFLKKMLGESSQQKATIYQVSKELLEKYTLNQPDIQRESKVLVSNTWILMVLTFSLILNLYFIFYR